MNDNKFSNEDVLFMHLALELGERGMGLTEPNPMVGAVVVKDGKVLSTGYHRKFGEVHAERSALEKIKVKGTTLYVSLEPCSHTGHTPPCTDIIIEKGVSRVVIPFADPNTRVNGNGIKMLENEGIKVETGLLKVEAANCNRHYLKYISTGKPWVTINAGVTIDGKLSDKNRNSQWVTGEALRSISHSFRGEFSAIIVGSATVQDDDPMLTIREEGWEGKKFVRVILDSGNRLSTKMNIFNMGEEWPLYIFSGKEYESSGKKCDNHFFINSGHGGLHLNDVLRILGEKGIASILVEGGGALISSFLRSQLCDEVVLFIADKFLGGKKSVEIFSEGAPITDPVRLTNRSIIELDEGYIIRGMI
ncbi:MAG: bifunctional diaminohydroxyphosphoribosylaminopyrimidine deaminase/5-amino-6-(5-phosphoribosylamino)uracil reductase RibD [Candidatus Aminicenantes bacterium]|nr:bifunctional diaminohydroxyphosphoribosylaminopyrimidine deaminase/5-amino-6-(5-phosphoribosylamino)uracil reductase RibD [Candidatus Aminicenantes bacterium]